MFRFILVLAMAFYSFVLWSDDTIILNSETSKLNLSKSVYVYEDRLNTLDFETVSRPTFQENFIHNTKDSLNFSYSPYTYWFRFDLENLNTQTKDWFLEIGYSHLDSIEFYYEDEGAWTIKKYGDHLPFGDREIFSRFFVIPIELALKKNLRFYIKVKTATVVLVPLTLYTIRAYLDYNIRMEIWYACFYGAMGIMILYNGFIFIAFRSKSYFFYSLSTLFTLLFYISFNGHGFQFLWGTNIFWQNYSVLFLTSLSWISLLAFTSRFLEFNKNFPTFRKISVILKILFFVALVAILKSPRLCVMIQNLIATISAVFVFYAGMHSFRKGNRYARYFVIAWFTFLIGSILFICYLLNWIERNLFTMNVIQIGSLLELIILSFALADRYQIIQDESIRVQKETLESQRKINETLEEKVKARTSELNATLQLIKSDLAMAQKIQSATLATNLNQNEKLEIVVRYISMSEVGGDFYSVDKLDDATIRIFLADATGHGVQAALIMMAIQGIYDSIKNFALPVNEIMEIFNKEFIRRYGMLNSFLTCILVDIDTINQRLIYTSAGHPAGLIIKKGKEFQLLKNTGGLIGVTRKDGYGLAEFPFTKEERLFIFTDGIFEQFLGEEEFGEDRLYKILLQSKVNDIKDTLDHALAELEIFLGDTGKQDDITLIGIGYRG
jgi:serine phosphatase RsbU (regulator of sigma subunit)